MLLFQDKELGTIAVTVNVRSRHYVFRYRDGMLACTSPSPYREKALRETIDELRPKLKALLQEGGQKAQARFYTPQTRIDAEDFRLHFEQKDGVQIARMEMDGDGIVCYYASPEVLAEEGVQEWVTQSLEAFARRRVKARLVSRLLDMAARRGLVVTSVKVSSAKGRWGSCSARGSINLSLYLVLLPRHLQDYVLQHELTHRIEMNHSPRFWALLDEVCGGDAHALRKEMSKYRTSFLTNSF